MDFKAVAVGSVYTMMSRLVVLLCGFAVTVALARHLGPIMFGVYGLILSIVTWVEHTVAMGIPSVYRKVLSENIDATPAVLSFVSSVSAPYCLAIAGIFSMMSPLIAWGMSDQRLVYLLIISSLDIPLFGLYTTYMGILNGRGHFGAQSFLAGVYSVARTVLIVGAVMSGFGVVGALIGNAVGSFCGLVLAYYLTRRRVARDVYTAAAPVSAVDLKLRSRILTYGLPYLLTFLIASVFIHMDMWLVKAFTPNTDASNAIVGYYAVAYNFSKIPFFLIGAIAFTVFPAISKAVFEGRRADARSQITQSLTMVMIIALPMILVIIATADGLINFLFSSAYLLAADAFRILFAAVSVFSVFLLFLTIIAAENRQTMNLVFTVPLLPVAVILHAILIPKFGIEGAAMATAVVSVVGVLASGAYVWRRFGAIVQAGTMIRLFFANGCFYLITTIDALYEYHLLLGYAFLCVAYALLMLAFGLLNINMIRDIARSQFSLGKVATNPDRS